MARSYGLVPVSTWTDEAFTTLASGPQWLYLQLLTRRELSPGGVLPALPRRWAMRAADADAKTLATWLDVLEDAGWAYTDHGDQETFVSGFFEAEQIVAQPRRVVAAIDAIASISSGRLAAIASAELGGLLSAATAARAPRGVRAAVLERDGWKCRRCGWRPGDPVPLVKSGGRPVYRTLEIDHIWPKSRGGADEEANFQVLCTTCNASKGARV